ncbi:hypothetical protein PISMIDRAFT_673065 [Pisolithus microcarpus 441]|uniref:Uncharacterized protein n=1 Tax=Pisolithus microcarpus 441 TaxID=765257 RepID=A0A0C9YUW2_9AGAM|nr:hypothetical protein PISMIDRAFT_673065 [Pisolithus microcarpus 441]
MTERPPISTLYYATRMTMGNRRMEASIKTQCNQYQYNDEQWSEIKQTQRATKTRGASRCMYGRRENTKWE